MGIENKEPLVRIYAKIRLFCSDTVRHELAQVLLIADDVELLLIGSRMFGMLCGHVVRCVLTLEALVLVLASYLLPTLL